MIVALLRRRNWHRTQSDDVPNHLGGAELGFLRQWGVHAEVHRNPGQEFTAVGVRFTIVAGSLKGLAL